MGTSGLFDATALLAVLAATGVSMLATKALSGSKAQSCPLAFAGASASAENRETLCTNIAFTDVLTLCTVPVPSAFSGSPTATAAEGSAQVASGT
eukprot:834895-Pleurochrysis_carterae.AAC.1